MKNTIYVNPGKKKRISILPYILILPAMALFMIFNFYPFLKAILLSFSMTNKQGEVTQWVGLANWVRVLGSIPKFV